MTTQPVRIRRSRAKGAKLVSPNGLPIVCVTRPGRWGNQFKIGDTFTTFYLHGKPVIDTVRDAGHAVDKMRDMLYYCPNFVRAIKSELKDKNLACWCHIWKCPVCGWFFDWEISQHHPVCAICADKQKRVELVRVPCHADVLLKIANE